MSSQSALQRELQRVKKDAERVLEVLTDFERQLGPMPKRKRPAKTERDHLEEDLENVLSDLQRSSKQTRKLRLEMKRYESIFRYILKSETVGEAKKYAEEALATKSK